ncbi:hypothetical protein [Pseudoalteromonas rubra]|uniref:hypothetical protein n=1 Tax=Pseudoalteromonas rubra TaxID=43658 RepID=UPI002DBF1E1E|nr:hypothetical protein [Pseudoalteromonas rubra]MEC4091899.1 hypothetical protein [Pseudoalteromonas rubra]
MTPEQELELFKSIGQIQATQTSILKEVTDIKADLTKRLEKVEDRIGKVEGQVTNNRVKLATASGLTGIAAALTAELLKLGGG